TIFEKTFKQKNIAANAIQEFSFTRDEFSQVQENKSVMAFAEMRWLISDKEIKALGSTELILVNGYFLKDQGKPVSDEKEMTDMKVYRTFWNKIWEAPVLDSSKQGGGRKKYLWELNANLKYSFTLTAEHDSNGIQETRVLKGPSDKESMTEKVEG